MLISIETRVKTREKEKGKNGNAQFSSGSSGLLKIYTRQIDTYNSLEIFIAKNKSVCFFVNDIVIKINRIASVL